MNSKIIEFAMKEARRILEATGDSFDDDDIAETADELMADWESEAGDQCCEDTPSIQSADLNGTGEGRFHGLI